MAETFLYFAYGSNMLTRRLSDRAPSARLVSTGSVKRRRLMFNKVSDDDSAKCNAEPTGNDTDRVYGVIFEIEFADKPALDAAEELGTGYAEESVDVATGGGGVTALTYIAIRKGSALKPYHWYKSLTIAGAVEHGLPQAYIEWLRTTESIEDTNEARRARHEALLFTE